MNCQGCGAPRKQLKVVTSSIMNNKKFNMCSDCADRKIEPRWAIILIARSFGMDYVKDVVNNRRYVGDDISIHDIFS